MKEFINYTRILGIVDNYSDEKLDEIIKEYENKKKQELSKYKLAGHNHDLFLKNINALNDIKKRRSRIKIEKNFKFKKEHLELLKSMRVNIINQDKLTLTLPREEEISKIFDIKHYDKDGGYIPEDDAKINLCIEELNLALEFILNEFILNEKN